MPSTDLSRCQLKHTFLPLDADQRKSLLWGEFQNGIAQRRDNHGATAASQSVDDAPLRKPPRKKAGKDGKSRRKLNKAAEGDDASKAPADWPARVAQQLREAMQASHTRVRSIFREFDSDGSGAVDCYELESALQALGILDALGVPPEEQRSVVITVFDAFDLDGDGVLDFSELQEQLRVGKHEVELAPELKPGGAGPVSVERTQVHHVRKKEEWKALERFDELLDADGDGFVTTQEALSLLLSEGYDTKFVTSLMSRLDADGNGVVDREEWRQGVRALPPSLLLALTDPVAPPSGEAFTDLSVPVLIERAPTYHRTRGSTTIVAVDERSVPGPRTQGCTIAEIEHRAIALPQLRSLLAHIQRRCPAEKWVSSTGEKLHASLVNLYDSMAYVVKPATRARKCSLVELVADGPQPPQWFASYWWGTAVEDFVTCLEQHARDRALDLNTVAYWSCGYALSQWNAEEMRKPMQSFARAMSAASKGVVTVVDKGAHCFSRLWVGYESFAAAREREVRDGFAWDIYTACSHRLQGELTVHSQGRCTFSPGASSSSGDGLNIRARETDGPTVVLVGHDRAAVGLADGFVATDDETPRAKLAREAWFPVKLLVDALNVEMLKGETTVTLDRSRLLNVLAGVDDEHCDDDPPTQHEQYGNADAWVRSNIATRCIVRAVSEGGALHRNLVPVLSAALHIRTLALPPESHFPMVNRQRYEDVLDALPRSLHCLHAPLPRTIRSLQEGTLGKLDELTHLDLSASTSLEALPEDLTELEQLTVLDLSGCRRLETVPSRVYDLPKLTTLNLSFTRLGAVSASGAHPSAITTLMLEGCTELTELPETAGAKLSKLTSLTLKGCANLGSLPSWIARLEKLDNAVIRPAHLA